MSDRLTPLVPEKLDDGARSLYDAVMASPRAQGPGRRLMVREDGTLTGPFDAWLRSPELGRLLEGAGMAFRTATALSPAAREVAVLVVSKAWDATFEWWVHAMLARMSEVPESAIEAIGRGRRPEFEDAECAAAHDVAVELVYRRCLGARRLEAARAALGERALIEVVTLVGFYQMVSGVLTSLEPPPPSNDLDVVGPPDGNDHL